MEFQFLQQQLEKLNQHLETLQENVEEIEISIHAVEELGKTKMEQEILAPIANGVFLKAKLNDNQKLIVNVGADTTVEKTVPQVVKMLEEQYQNLQEKVKEVIGIMEEMNQQTRKIYQEVEKLSEE